MVLNLCQADSKAQMDELNESALIYFNPPLNRVEIDPDQIQFVIIQI